MSSTNASPIDLYDFERRSSNLESRSSSQRPSISSADSDWYLSKPRRRSRGGSTGTSSSSTGPCTKSPEDDSLTLLHPAMEASLAILTSGLSVVAFHAVKSISERRASKKLKASKRQWVGLPRQESLLVPSSVAVQSAWSPDFEAEPIAELDGPPIESLPAYSANVMKPVLQ